MSKKYLPYISYSIWREFAAAIGSEIFHCDMKRGFARARKKEDRVQALLAEEKDAFKIGHWVQKGIYELHQNSALLDNPLGVDILKDNLTYKKIRFTDESPELQQKVIDILKRYQQKPILNNQKIIEFSPGDEAGFTSILLQERDYQFRLFYAFDCVIEKENETIHILDLKTGKSGFDLRQGYVYLLAASQVYPKRNCVASFYNVETEEASEILSLTPEQLYSCKLELAKIAKLHQEQLKKYRFNQDLFARIYSPNPGLACRFCQFNSICNFSVIE